MAFVIHWLTAHLSGLQHMSALKSVSGLTIPHCGFLLFLARTFTENHKIMYKRHIYVLLAVLSFGFLNAQTIEELTALKETKSAELSTLQAQLDELTGQVDALTAEVDNLTDQITPYPRWDIGGHGNIGINLSQYSDWLNRSSPNTIATSLGITGNAFANLDQKKYIWLNSMNFAFGWQRFKDEDDPEEDGEYKVTSDVFSIKSLLGYKLTETLSISVLGEYRSTILENINDPGYLDLGAGLTWTPVTDLVVVVHPLNYNFVFYQSDDFEYQSSMGAKFVADYKLEIVKNLAWTSNFSGFLSYEGTNLSNWTWINSLTTNVKGFGLGLDFGLRGNKQEALAAGLSDNPLQFYWVFGLTYAF